eukprot:7206683-Lingulodinium_polyedra.AAC.1
MPPALARHCSSAKKHPAPFPDGLGCENAKIRPANFPGMVFATETAFCGRHVCCGAPRLARN